MVACCKNKHVFILFCLSPRTIGGKRPPIPHLGYVSYFTIRIYSIDTVVRGKQYKNSEFHLISVYYLSI